MSVRTTITAVVLLACAGCAPRDAEIRRARMVAERRALEATLDHLEDRLVVSQARVRFWNEMRERHESVAAIACASMEEHALEMARREGARGRPEQYGARGSSLDRARVASVRTPSEPSPPPSRE